MTAAELMEQGIRAYTRGQLGEAERCWRDVLALDPANARARSYLELLVGKLVRNAPPPPEAAVPLPPPSPPRPAPPPAARPGAPVPLPAPIAAAPPAPAPARSRAEAPRVETPARFEAQPAPTPPPVGVNWMGPPLALTPPAEAETVQADEFASCWESGVDEITTPITIAEPIPEPAAAPSGYPLASRATTDFADLEVGGPAHDLPENVVTLPTAVPERTTLSDYAPSPWDQGPASAPAVVLDDGVGLDLATVAEQSGLRSLVPEAARPEAVAPAPRSEVDIWMEGARELFALGDFSGSLEMIEKILKIDPSHAEAREYLKQNEATLIAMYESKLGPSGAIPRLAIQPEEVMWLNLDHRAGFLLAQIDGTVSYEDLFALSGLPRLDTARILATLLQEGVVRS